MEPGETTARLVERSGLSVEYVRGIKNSRGGVSGGEFMGNEGLLAMLEDAVALRPGGSLEGRLGCLMRRLDLDGDGCLGQGDIGAAIGLDRNDSKVKAKVITEFKRRLES